MSEKVNCIQLGANCGRTETDMVWIYCQKENWNCIFVEPLPASFNSLKTYYNTPESGTGTHIFENVAIIPETKLRNANGDVTLHFSEKPQLSVMASLNSSHRSDHNTLSVDVPALTLDELIDKHNMRNIPFDILQVDIEGFDAAILLASDFSTINPKYIRYESHHISPHTQTEVAMYLNGYGYEAVQDKFWNTYQTVLKEEVEKVWDPEALSMNTLFERKEDNG